MAVNLNSISQSPMTRAGDSNGNIISNDPNNKPTGKTSLDMNDFFKLLAAQLANQDMSNPMDDSQFMAQMTQMATVEAMNTFTDISMTTYANSLIGKDVTVVPVDETNGSLGEPIKGTVTGVSLAGGQYLAIDDKFYHLSQVLEVGKVPKKEEDDKDDSGGDGSDGDKEEKTSRTY